MIFDAKLGERVSGQWLIYVRSPRSERILFYEEELFYVVKFCLLKGIKINPSCFRIDRDSRLVPTKLPPELSNL